MGGWPGGARWSRGFVSNLAPRLLRIEIGRLAPRLLRIEVVHEIRDSSLISTRFSRHSTCPLSGLGLCLTTPDRCLGLGLFGLGRCPMAPDLVESQDHESDQRPPTPPLVPHLLHEAEHPVGPLHLIVGPHPP